MTGPDEPMLEVRNLVVQTPHRRRSLLDRAPDAARYPDGVSLRVGRGETYGVIGESASSADALAGAVVRGAAPATGQILVGGVDVGPADDESRRVLRRRVRMLRPSVRFGRRTVAAELDAELRSTGLPSPGAGQLRALCDEVGLSAAVLDRYEHDLPGGQRRRVDVARALCTDPELVVAAEPVADLDVTVAAQLLDLLGRLRTDRGLTYLLLARDLGVVRHLSDRVGVLYLGRIVEEAPARALYRSPWHPYTRALLSAVPVPDPEVEDRRERILLTGDLPSVTPPAGCPFHPRCPWRRPQRCTDERPLLRAIPGTSVGHIVACHHAEDLGR